jgi:uncharacterized protein
MPSATIRFYATLNDLLPPHRRQTTFSHDFTLRTSIKDLIESFSVPHTEVDLVLINGEPVDFAYLVQDGDRISVYPVFKSIDISTTTHTRPPALENPRFILDVHLGKLAGFLRLLGFDVLYENQGDDEDLARISANQNRIMLTRDRGLLMRNAVVYGYCVRATEPRQQLLEIIERFDLLSRIKPFQRCLRCNEPLEPVNKEAVLNRLPPKVRESHHEFHICRCCDQVYWPGTHHEKMQDFINAIIREAQGDTAQPDGLTHPPADT